MASFDSRTIYALTLSFIAFTDICVILDIPILRQVLGFVLLTFLPGFLLIQILKLTKNPLEKLLFLIGLSICFLMFVPLAMNFAYPALGISRPISLIPLIITFSLILAALSFVSYRKVPVDFQITKQDIRVSISRILSPVALGAALILVLGILGALFVWFYSDSIFSLLSWFSIVLIVALIAISRRIPERFYPLFVFIIALTLQYNRTLSTPNLFGVDAHYELYFANLVQSIGYWNPYFTINVAAYSEYHAMLSVVVLPNVYSILLNIGLIWVFKLISPFVFAFVPLGLYQIYQTQIRFSSKAAFLATFFFMSFYAFYLAMPWVTRMEVGVLFVVLVTLLITSKYVHASKKPALLILFIAGMVVSHYATSYIFLFYLVVLLTGCAIIASKNRQKRSTSVVTPALVSLAFVITFGWYLFASGGTPYQALVTVGSHTYHALVSGFFAPSTSAGVQAGIGGGLAGLTLTHTLSHLWQILTEALIAIGLGFVIWRRKTQKMNTVLLLFALASSLVLLIEVFLPSLGGAINPYRAYLFALLFLAPCCVLGVEAIFDFASRWLHMDKHAVSKLECAVLIGVLIPYFLFQGGVIFELTENPSNYAFLPSPNESQRVLVYTDNQSWSYLGASSPIPVESVYACKWLSSTMGPFPVYADVLRREDVIGYGLISPNSVIILTHWNVNQSLANAYIYLGAQNVQQGKVLPQAAPELQISTLRPFTTANRIYSNGLGEVYYSH